MPLKILSAKIRGFSTSYHCRDQVKEAIQRRVILPKESIRKQALEMLTRQSDRMHGFAWADNNEFLHGQKLN